MKDECRFRWKELHQQRKGEGKPQVTNKPSQETEGEAPKIFNYEADQKAHAPNQQQLVDEPPQKIEPGPSEAKQNSDEEDRQAVERLLRLSARPFENPMKGLSLAELEKMLPKTRTKKDFLSGSEYEFDKKLDTVFTGEKIAPSGFNILKDKIRKRDESDKQRELDFLKNLEKMALEETEEINDKPLIFSANFGVDSSISIVKFDIEEEAAQKRLFMKAPTEKLEYNVKPGALDNPLPDQFEEVKKGEVKDSMQKGQSKDPKKQGEAVLQNKTSDQGPIKDFKIQFSGKDDLFGKEEVNIDDVVSQFDKLFKPANTKPATQAGKKNETEAKNQPLSEPPQKLTATQSSNQLNQPLKQTNLNAVQASQDDIKIEDLNSSLVQTVTKVDETNVIKEKPKEEQNPLFQGSKSQLSQNASQRVVKGLGRFGPVEVNNFEDDFEEEDDFFEKQRLALKGVNPDQKTTTSDSKISAAAEKPSVESNHIQPEKPRKSAVSKDNEEEKNERSVSTTTDPKKVTFREESVEIADVASTKSSIESSKAPSTKSMVEHAQEGETFEITYDKQEFKSRPLESSILKKKDEPRPQQAENEKRISRQQKSSSRQKKQPDPEPVQDDQDLVIDEQIQRLAKLWKEVEQKNKDITKEQNEQMKFLNTAEEAFEETHQKALLEKRREEFGNSFKTGWTNSHIGNFYDETISGLAPCSTIPNDLLTKMEGHKPNENIFTRYHIICLPVILDQSLYLRELLDYFLRNSRLGSASDFAASSSQNSFPYKLVTFTLTVKFGVHQRNKIEKEVMNQTLNEELYLLFDTADTRGKGTPEEVLESIQLDQIFQKETVKRIQTKFNFKSDQISLKDLVLLHYRGSAETIKDVFCSNSAFNGICLEKFQDDPKITSQFEYSLVITNFYYAEGQNDSNFSQLVKRLTEQNLTIYGIKMAYFGAWDLKEFKSKVALMRIEANRPLLVMLVGGYKIFETMYDNKVKTIVGLDEPDLCKRLDPNAINAIFADYKKGVSLWPLNKQRSAKWISYFFGGRVTKAELENCELKKPISQFEVLTKPFRKYTVMISDKVGMKNIPLILKQVLNRGYEILDFRLVNKSHLKACLNEAPNELLVQFYDMIDKNINSGFEFRGNNVNLILEVYGEESEFLAENLTKELNRADSSERVVSICKDTQFAELISKLFMRPRLSVEVEDFTPAKDFDYGIYLYEVNEALNDAVEFQKDLAFFASKEAEIIGVDYIHGSTIKEEIRGLLEEALLQSNKIPANLRKKSEFTNFFTHSFAHLLKSKFLIAYLRIQSPSHPIEELVKSTQLAHSNWNVSETDIFSRDKNVEITSYKNYFTKILLKTSLDELLKVTQGLSSILSDDKSIITSFIHDLPPKNASDSSVHSFAVIGQQAMRKLTLNFVSKLIEQKGLKIERFRFTKMSKKLIDRSHDELSERLGHLVMELITWKDRWEQEPVWVLDISGPNSIFQTKLLMKTFLEKLNDLESSSKSKGMTSMETIDLFYGVYYPKNFQNWKRDRKMIQALLVPNASKGLAIVESSEKRGTQYGCLLFRVNQKNGRPFSLNKVLATLHSINMKVINICKFEELKGKTLEAIHKSFSLKHNKTGLGGFLTLEGAQYWIIAFEVRPGTSFLEEISSFKLKEDGEPVVFYKGELYKQFGPEFLGLEIPKQVSDIFLLAFDQLNSDYFALKNEEKKISCN